MYVYWFYLLSASESAVSDCVVVRITLIALVSITGSVVMIIGLTTYEMIGITPSTYLLVVTGSILDVLLDSICVALSLNIYEKQYDAVCSGCDSGLRRCCVKLTDRTTRKKEMELAEIHRHQTSTPESINKDPTSRQSTKKQSIRTHLDGPPIALSPAQSTPTGSTPV